MPDILLSSFTSQRMRTASGDAIAADLMSGKKALVNGVLVTGTATDKKPLVGGNDIHLYMQNPIGVSDSAYSPATEHGNILVKNSSWPTIQSHSSWVLKNTGDAWANGTFQHYARCVAPPAYSVRRKYEVWGKFINDASFPDAGGVKIYINYTDTNNHWAYHLRRDTAWGGFYTQIYEVTAGVTTIRHDTGGLTSALDMPLLFNMTLYEQGDGLVGNVACFETDDFTLDFKSNFYTVASRPHKAVTEFRITNASDLGDYVQIQGVRISDLLL